ncbi:sphingosine kinase [Waterburya agarophytonicola K14]|uniref:Sphingosine kinase n=1 Tax=Waterburya agarophytonicola KI4 TaxID=2874699 RepID=A0A964BQN2_9CYAN|nr:diacylglycerol kinase family protein [Waterburya agarophytonicola]MCC0176738.1 sphingosine kinase [Waterburya agarophytonicola KI4]
MKSTVLFEHPLALLPEKPEKSAILISNALFWQEKGEQRQLLLQDVVGVSMSDREESEFPCLLIHAYPYQKNSRVLKEYCFTCASLAGRSLWQQAINNVLVGQPIDAVDRPRYLQVIVNPVSGKQRALKIFDRIRPLFDHSYLNYSVKQTSSSRDIQDFVSNLDLTQVDGLVIVGGDGTVHDAIAGLMNRLDWEKAIRLPLGIIPGGTGNGLSKSLLEFSGEIYDPLNAAFLIAKGKQQSLDLAAIKQNNRNYYSCLSLAWGLISDADIESEKFKFLGSLRFDLYGLFLILLLRTYKGKFSFIPHPDCHQNLQQTTKRKGEWHIIEDDFIFLWAMNVPWAAHDMNVTPYARLNDGAIDVLVMRKGTSRWELLNALLLCGKGKHLDLPHMEYYKVRSFCLEPLTKKGILVVDGELVNYSSVEMQIMPSMVCINN